MTLSCACYTNTAIDLGLHNQTCNCELNLSTVVTLIRVTFVTILCLCITAFLTFIILYRVGLRSTYHFTPIFIMYCMAAFVNHND